MSNFNGAEYQNGYNLIDLNTEPEFFQTSFSELDRPKSVTSFKAHLGNFPELPKIYKS